MIKKYCDKCGKELRVGGHVYIFGKRGIDYITEERPARVTLEDDGEMKVMAETTIELCECCSDDFIKAIKPYCNKTNVFYGKDEW